jgi:adenylate cyclase
VLIGEIDRHSVQRIRAVIWFCDLRGFSLVANRVAQEELVEILDAYLEAMARPVLDHQGQILKFMGDGFLATFDSRSATARWCAPTRSRPRPLPDHFPRSRDRKPRASARSISASLCTWEKFSTATSALRAPDFTVVGSAVNEASRIEGMCRPLQQALVSQSFREVPRKAATDASCSASCGRHPRAAGAFTPPAASPGILSQPYSAVFGIEVGEIGAIDSGSGRAPTSSGAVNLRP